MLVLVWSCTAMQHQGESYFCFRLLVAWQNASQHHDTQMTSNPHSTNSSSPYADSDLATFLALLM